MNRFTYIRDQFERRSATALFVVLALSLSVNPAIAATVRVTSGSGPEALSRAIGRTEPGDTVVVSSGVYSEHSIEIVHPLTVIGEDYPVIDAGGNGQILTVLGRDVTILGLELRNVGTSFMEDRAAIKYVNTSGGKAENNRIINGFFGIYLENSEHCLIRDNEIHGSATRETTSGNGVHSWHCRNITVDGNVITGHRDGIYFEFVNDSRIVGNHSESNLRYGLHFMFSNNDVYTDNTFVQNGAGVAVMYSSNVSMEGNRFERNWGGGAYGLLLKEIKDSEIVHNEFYRNTVGLYSEGSNRVKVVYNDFVENGYGVKIMANSMENVFSYNNFVGNTFDVTTNSRQNFNTFRSNYWSDYKGYDLDGDGVGDIAYYPVRLFSLLVERVPSGVILMNSLFVKIIDTAERVMPVFTPETLTDEQPLIKALRFDERS